MNWNSMKRSTDIGCKIVPSPMNWEMCWKYQSNRIWKSKICQIAWRWVHFNWFSTSNISIILAVNVDYFCCCCCCCSSFSSWKTFIYFIHSFSCRLILAEKMSHLPCIFILSAKLLPNLFRSKPGWIFIRLVHNSDGFSRLWMSRHGKYLFGELISTNMKLSIS